MSCGGGLGLLFCNGPLDCSGITRSEANRMSRNAELEPGPSIELPQEDLPSKKASLVDEVTSMFGKDSASTALNFSSMVAGVDKEAVSGLAANLGEPSSSASVTVVGKKAAPAWEGNAEDKPSQNFSDAKGKVQAADEGKAKAASVGIVSPSDPADAVPGVNPFAVSQLGAVILLQFRRKAMALIILECIVATALAFIADAVTLPEENWTYCLAAWLIPGALICMLMLLRFKKPRPIYNFSRGCVRLA